MNKKAKSLMFASVALLLISIVAVCFIIATDMTAKIGTPTINGITNSTDSTTIYSNTYNMTTVFTVTPGTYDIKQLNFTLAAGITLSNNLGNISSNVSVVNSTDDLNITFIMSSIFNGARTFTLNLTSTADGRKNINLTAYTIPSSDTVANKSVFYIVVDTAKPNVNITYPFGGANFTTKTGINVTLTSSDININYTNVTIYLNGVAIRSGFNQSASQNHTMNFTFPALSADGHYVINVSTFDKAGNQNSSYVNITVDTTAPNVTITTPLNNWAVNPASNTIYLLNVTVTDTITGMGAINRVLFNLTNLTGGIQNNTFVAEVSADGKTYTNSTGFNLTSYPDGRYNLTVYANDTIGIDNTSVRSQFYVDRLAPYQIVTTPISTGQTSINFSITITDATSGVNTSCVVNRSGTLITMTDTGLLQYAYESGLTAGTAYTYNVSCSDRAGNMNTSGVYTVTTNATATTTASSSGGGLPASAITYSVSLTNTGDSVDRNLRTGDGVKFIVASVSHSVTLKSLSNASVTVTIASTPIDATLVVGETKKFDLNGDGTFDIAVTYNGLMGRTFAKINVASISEPMTSQEIVQQKAAEAAATAAANPTEPTEKSNMIWWIVGIVVVIIIIAVVIAMTGKKK